MKSRKTDKSRFTSHDIRRGLRFCWRAGLERLDGVYKDRQKENLRVRIATN